MTHAEAGVLVYHRMERPLPIVASPQPSNRRGLIPTPLKMSRPVIMLEGTVENMTGNKATPVEIGDLWRTPWK